MPSDIPLVDISKCGLLVAKDEDVSEQDFRDAGDQLRSALSTLGVAYLTNHGIPWSDVDSLNNVVDKFYDQPDEVKRRLWSHNLILDYDPPGKSKVDTEHYDRQEGFRVSGEAFEDENIEWPNVPNIKEAHFDFASKGGHILLRLLKALGFGLKIKDKDHFVKVHSLINKKGNLAIVKTARYTPAPVDDVRPEEKPRYGEHRDFSTLSLLFQDDVGGLQVKDVSGEFIDVVPIPGAIVLNVGLTLEAWTGNRLKAVVHRVYPPKDLEKRNQVRKSLIYFGQANKDALIAKVEFEDEEDDSEPAENPLTVAQFMKKLFDELME